MRDPLEVVLPGTVMVAREGPVGDGSQSSVERVSCIMPDGEQRQLVVRSPRTGALGMDAVEDCARRVMALYRTRHLPYCPEILAVWGGDGDGHVVNPGGTTRWYVAEEAVEGVPLASLLIDPESTKDLTGMFLGLGRQLGELHATPEEPRGRSPRRGVYEALAGAEGAMTILAGLPAHELASGATIVGEYVALAAQAAWRLEPHADRPTATCHGDLHPGNILVGSGGRLSFIDRSRIETCEPASDVASVLVNLIRLAISPPGGHSKPAELADAFISAYHEGAPAGWERPLGYYVLTRMPAAVSQVFNPTISADTRWRALRWTHSLVAGGAPCTADEWRKTIRSIVSEVERTVPHEPV